MPEFPDNSHAAGGGVQGAGGVGEDGEAHVPAPAHRAQAGQPVPGDQVVPGFSRDHRDVSAGAV